MATNKVRLRARDVDLLISRVLRAGLAVEAVELTPDGALRVLTQPSRQGCSCGAFHDRYSVDLSGAQDPKAADAERRMISAFGR